VSPPAQIASLLMGLRVKGDTPEEVAGAARALREAMVRVEANGAHLVDTCGTGGGVVSTFNISTAAAVVAAGAGAVVAKHGNRAFTSKCGSADVLEALGVRIRLRAAGSWRVRSRGAVSSMRSWSTAGSAWTRSRRRASRMCGRYGVRP